MVSTFWPIVQSGAELDASDGRLTRPEPVRFVLPGETHEDACLAG